MRDVLIGQTDYTVLVRITGTDGAPETGLAHTDIDIAYSRVETDNDVTTSDVAPADLANLTAAHTDWGWEEVSSTDHPGLYRLDIADAVFASGAWEAVVTITDASGSDFYAHDIGFRLVSFNVQDGVRLGLTALPNAAADAAGGLVISDAGGFDVDNRAPAAAAITNMNTVFSTDFAVNYNTTNDGWVVKLGDYAHGGSSANTTLGTLTTGAVSISTFASSGTVTFNALTVTNATTLSGAVSLGSTLGVTGAITATNASNNVRLGTLTVDTNAIAWASAWDAEVQSEVQDALEANNLDHLVKIAVDTNFATTVHADSVVGQIADNGAGFDRTTDSLEAIRDRGDAAWTTATGFSTHSASDVWAVATRVLTALDEDTTTLDLDATVRAAVGLASANLDTQLDALPTAAENATAVLTTAMTESYSTDGGTATLAQAVYLIMQMLTEKSISSTTLTVKKLDGSTTAATFTLDSATTPTSITRSG